MQTEEAKSTAREEAGAVAESIKDESKNVAQTAQEEARDAFHHVQSDVRERADAEATKFAGTLHDTSRQLRSMADGTTEQQGFAATLAREGASAAERLANRLDAGGIDGVMADVRSWARRSPGTFLLGAAAAGFVTGRLIRNMSTNGDRTPRTGFAAEPGVGYAPDPSSAYAPEPTMPGGLP
jgi:hypothetical protein